MPTALVVLAEGFEELEAVGPVDILRRAGVDVTVAALAEGIHVTGRSGVTVHADGPLSRVLEAAYDCIVLPGGPGVALLRADPRVRQAVVAQHAAGRWVAAICAAPLVLLDAGLLAGRRYTAHFSTAAELGAILASERTVCDGTILTSRGAGTAVDFGLAIAEKLAGPEAAQKVASSICA